MPGIVGLVTKMPRSWAEPQLARMVESLRHEAFYRTGAYVEEGLGIYVGWAVQKDSFADGGPICNERGDISMVFSGEEFPDPGTTERLKKAGHLVRIEGMSYLVHLYEEDPTFPRGLNGMFHGLIIDRTTDTVTLFNDRFGMHRVYYHESKDAFYFAAEAKSILAVRKELRTPDPRGLGEFLSLSCVLEDRTLFQGISVLPAASAWRFRGGVSAEKQTYFRPEEWEGQPALDSGKYYRELREVFSKNLPRYFGGKEQIGMTVTGGLDTRVIMAWQKHPSGSLPCYTFGGMLRDCQDVLIARRVTRLCDQPHEVIEVGRDFLAGFPHYAERTVYLTEGGVDVHRSADLYVSERARHIAPVKVVGTYGSEILRHAVMFKPAKLQGSLFCPDLVSQVSEAEATYARIRLQHPVTFAAFRQSPWYHHGILSLERTQLTVRSPYLDNEFVRTVFCAPRSENGGSDLRLQLIREGNSALARIRSDRGVGGGPRALNPVLHGLLEFTFKAEYAYDYGMPHWVAKVDHALAPLRLERLFLGRHKFAHFRLWYRDALAEYVRGMLLDSRTLSRPYLNRRGVESIVNGHTRGIRNYTTEIHKLLTLELLHRQFFESR